VKQKVFSDLSGERLAEDLVMNSSASKRKKVSKGNAAASFPSYALLHQYNSECWIGLVDRASNASLHAKKKSSTSNNEENGEVIVEYLASEMRVDDEDQALPHRKRPIKRRRIPLWNDATTTPPFTSNPVVLVHSIQIASSLNLYFILTSLGLLYIFNDEGTIFECVQLEGWQREGWHVRRQNDSMWQNKDKMQTVATTDTEVTFHVSHTPSEGLKCCITCVNVRDRASPDLYFAGEARANANQQQSRQRSSPSTANHSNYFPLYTDNLMPKSKSPKRNPPTPRSLLSINSPRDIANLPNRTCCCIHQFNISFPPNVQSTLSPTSTSTTTIPPSVSYSVHYFPLFSEPLLSMHNVPPSKFRLAASWTHDGSLLGLCIGFKLSPDGVVVQKLMYLFPDFMYGFQATDVHEFTTSFISQQLDHGEYVSRIQWRGHDSTYLALCTNRGRLGMVPRMATFWKSLECEETTPEGACERSSATVLAPSSSSQSNQTSPFTFLKVTWSTNYIAITDGLSVQLYHVQESPNLSGASHMLKRAQSCFHSSRGATSSSSSSSSSQHIEDELLFCWRFIFSHPIHSRDGASARAQLKSLLTKLVEHIGTGNYITKMLKKYRTLVTHLVVTVHSSNMEFFEWAVHEFARQLLALCLRKKIDADVCVHFLGVLSNKSHVNLSKVWLRFFDEYPSLKTPNSELHPPPFDLWIQSGIFDAQSLPPQLFDGIRFNDAFWETLSVSEQRELLAVCEKEILSRATSSQPTPLLGGNISENDVNHHKWKVICQFLDLLIHYRLEEAYDLVCIALGEDICITHEEVPSSIKPHNALGLKLLKAFVSLLCLDLNNKTPHVLPVVLSQTLETDDLPLVVPSPFADPHSSSGDKDHKHSDNPTAHAYYIQLDSHRVRNHVLKFLTASKRRSHIKLFLVNAWIVARELEMALSCCIHFRMWNYLIKLNMHYYEAFDKHAVQHILFTEMNQFIEQKKFSYVRKLLTIASVYQPTASNQLRMDLVSRFSQQILDELKEDNLLMQSHVVPQNFTQKLVELVTMLNDEQTHDKRSSIVLNQLLFQHQSGETSTLQGKDSFPVIDLFADCLSLFSSSRGKLMTLFTLYRSLHGSSVPYNRTASSNVSVTQSQYFQSTQMDPFRKMCRLLWYCHLKSTILDHVGKLSEFKHTYSHSTRRSVDHEALLATIAHKLILLSCFTDVHTLSVIQGSILTSLSMLHSAPLIADLLLSAFPTEESVIPTLRYKLDQIYTRVERMDSKVFSTLIQKHSEQSEEFEEDVWAMERESEYWNYLDNLFHLLTSDEMFSQSRNARVLEYVNQTVNSLDSSYVLLPDPSTPQKLHVGHEGESSWMEGDTTTRAHDHSRTVIPMSMALATPPDSRMDEEHSVRSESLDSSLNSSAVFEGGPEATSVSYQQDHLSEFSNSHDDPTNLTSHGNSHFQDYPPSSVLQKGRSPQHHHHRSSHLQSPQGGILPKLFNLRPLNRDEIAAKYAPRNRRAPQRQLGMPRTREPKIFNIPGPYKSKPDPRRAFPTNGGFFRLDKYLGRQQEPPRTHPPRPMTAPQQQHHANPKRLRRPAEEAESPRSPSGTRQSVIYARPQSSYEHKFSKSLDKHQKPRSKSLRPKTAVPQRMDLRVEQVTRERPPRNEKPQITMVSSKQVQAQKRDSYSSAVSIKSSSATSHMSNTSQSEHVQLSDNFPVTKEMANRSPRRNSTSSGGRRRHSAPQSPVFEEGNFSPKHFEDAKMATVLVDPDDDSYMSKFKKLDSALTRNKKKGKVAVAQSVSKSMRPLVKDHVSQSSLRGATLEPSPASSESEDFPVQVAATEEVPVKHALRKKKKQAVRAPPSPVSNSSSSSSSSTSSSSHSKQSAPSSNDSVADSHLDEQASINSSVSINSPRLRFSEETERRYLQHLRNLGMEPGLRKLSSVLPVVTKFEQIQRDAVLRSPTHQNRFRGYDDSAFDVNPEFQSPPPKNEVERTLREKLGSFLSTKKIDRTPPSKNYHSPVPFNDIPEDDLDFELHPDIKKMLNKGDDLLSEFQILQQEMDEAHDLINELHG